MIKTVFFDALHTLFEAKPNQMEMFQTLIKEYTGNEIPLSEIKAIIDKLLVETEKASVEMDDSQKCLVWGSFPEQILEAIGYTRSDKAEVARNLRRETWENPYNYYLSDDVLPTLIGLKDAGIRIACVSNEDVHLNNFFVHFGIDQYFDFILVSEEVNCEKPNKLIFEEALNRANMEANEVLFVGDSYISDYEGPRKVGIKAVLLDRSGQNKKNIEKIGKLTDVLEYLKGETHANTTS
jgi:HAD superfamily hydrolase (TIGR01549 family)